MDTPTVKRIVQLLKNHPGEIWTPTTMADASGCSPAAVAYTLDYFVNNGILETIRGIYWEKVNTVAMKVDQNGVTECKLMHYDFPLGKWAFVREAFDDFRYGDLIFYVNGIPTHVLRKLTK